jgi:4-hydroxyphenylacetate 3-monooxygenase
VHDAPLPLAVRDVVSGREIPLLGARVVVAAYTGSDRAAVDHHIAELAAHGVPAPASVPTSYAVASDTLVLGPSAIRVPAATTSGEAEPVLIRLPGGELLLGVGSDHTDREIEKRSILDAKRACPKLLGRDVWPLEEVIDRWDHLTITSHVDGGRLYQRSELRAVRRPEEILGLVVPGAADLTEPLVLFLGTVPLRDGRFHFGGHFRAELHDPGAGRSLACEYLVDVAPPSSRPEPHPNTSA